MAEDFGNAVGRWLDLKVEKINRGNFRALEEGMSDGEEITQTFIATRGTAKSGKSGRVDTGTMLESVGSKTELHGQDEAVGRFGWLNKKPYYAAFQEPGTQYIEPMFALSDASEIVIQELVDKVDNNVRDA